MVRSKAPILNHSARNLIDPTDRGYAKTTRTIIATMLCLVLTASVGQTDVRNCFVPMVDGSSLNDCLTANGDCGKSAADAFCETGGQIKFQCRVRQRTADSFGIRWNRSGSEPFYLRLHICEDR